MKETESIIESREITEEEIKKAVGFSYRLNTKEFVALLFKQKKCRRCSGKLKRTIKTEYQTDGEVHRSQTSLFAPGQLVAVHQIYFECADCDEVVSITKFAEDNYGK